MPKVTEPSLLFNYVGSEFTPRSKPFQSRKQPEKAREKYCGRLRKTLALGLAHASGRKSISIIRVVSRSCVTKATSSRTRSAKLTVLLEEGQFE